MALWPALTLILSFLLMQPVKGRVVGLQWAMRMHGFGGEPDRPSGSPALGPIALRPDPADDPITPSPDQC